MDGLEPAVFLLCQTVSDPQILLKYYCCLSPNPDPSPSVLIVSSGPTAPSPGFSTPHLFRPHLCAVQGFEQGRFVLDLALVTLLLCDPYPKSHHLSLSLIFLICKMV